jgi:hypothetical protein
MLWSTTAQPAAAASCENVNYNVEVAEGGGSYEAIRSSVWFGTWNNDCNRISSLAGLSTSGNGFVEWGWVLGFSSCNNFEYSNPRLFTWWKPNNGASDCAVHSSAVSGAFKVLSLADGDSDTIWAANYDGGTVTSINVNFDRGVIETNSERDCTCDSAFGHYKSLDRQVVGAGWTPWSSPYLRNDNDPDYHWVKVSDTEHKVIHD